MASGEKRRNSKQFRWRIKINTPFERGWKMNLTEH